MPLAGAGSSNVRRRIPVSIQGAQNQEQHRRSATDLQKEFLPLLGGKQKHLSAAVAHSHDRGPGQNGKEDKELRMRDYAHAMQQRPHRRKAAEGVEPDSISEIERGNEEQPEPENNLLGQPHERAE